MAALVTRVPLLCAFVLAACGYSWVSPAAYIGDGIERVYVDRIEIADGGGDPVFGDMLRRSLRNEIRRYATVGLASSAATADAVLKVRLLSLATRPVAFDAYDEVLDYETTVVAEASLRESGGRVVWQRDRISSSRGHATVAEAVLGSSAAFQANEALSGEDLESMDSVQLGEQRGEAARRRLADDLAGRIHVYLMEGR